MRARLKEVVVAGLLLGAGLTLLGVLARWWPALDMVNNGLLFMTVGAVALLCLALAARDWRLVLAAAVLAAINVTLVIAALPGAAADAAPGSPRFLRVVTFNLWHYNDRMDDVAKFLAETDADAVVLQEVGKPNAALLRQALQSRYPYSVGDWGIIILSKHPILADGRIDRPGYPPWISLMVRWIRIEVNGTKFDLAGVHVARPFYPELQQEDVAALIAFANSRTLPLVMAGDFNMSPWTEKLGRFERRSGLKRYNTFHLTWPMQKRGVPLLPLVAIDNVFASPQFARIAVASGPRLDSDHRPIVADLALQPGADE
jgi:endonuclease/exonuclease/phosphatase (EEP) superfamily protein YafD